MTQQRLAQLLRGHIERQRLAGHLVLGLSRSMQRSRVRRESSVWWFGRLLLRYEPTMGDAAAVKLRADLAGRDWRAAQEFLSTIQHHDDRAFYLQQTGDVDGVEEWVQEWIDAEPVSTTPLLVAAQRFITWAWQARSARRARYVSRERFELFFQ